MADHSNPIVSIDSNYALDLYVSASTTMCVLRVASTNQYFLKIIPQIDLKVEYKLFKVLLSARGYLVIQARSKFVPCRWDMILVISINGEEVSRIKLNECINDIVFDVYHYHIVTFSYIKNSLLEGQVKDLRGI